MAKSVIANCPFCDAKPIRLELQPSYYSENDLASVHCMQCDAWGPTASTMDEAVELWNKSRKKPLAK